MDFDFSIFTIPKSRTRRGEGDLGLFDGSWGVRVHDCLVKGNKTTCIYASDMSAGLIIVALE